MKQMLFERSARAPLILSAPGVSVKGQSSQRVVEFVDLYPTLADLTGLTPPSGLHGRSLRPLLKDPRAAWDHPAVTQVRRGTAADGFFMGYSVRTERWRYTEWDDGKRGTELYDEKADPAELRNLAGDPARATVVAELQRTLRRVRGR
jgi:iduronate 2-sulfatase